MENISNIINSKFNERRFRFTKYINGYEEKNSEEEKNNLNKELEDIKICNERTTDKNSLLKFVQEWTNKNLSNDFKFREHQLENIVKTLDYILNHKTKIQVIEAPTGSGKSIICMIIAGVLWEYYRKTSYILVSDLGLMNQYIDDVNNFNLNWGHIRGLGNYVCHRNSLNVRSGECKLNNLGYNIMMNNKLAESKGYDCAANCQIMIDRKKSILSPITIMTYQLYLCYMNDVLPNYGPSSQDQLAPFDKRDVILCDECHKLSGIVQDWCSPEFNKKIDYDNFKNILTYLEEKNLLKTSNEYISELTADNLIDLQYKIYDAKTNEDAYIFYSKYFYYIENIVDKTNSIIDIINKKNKLDKQDKKILFIIEWIKDKYSHLDIYLNLWSKYPNFIVRNGPEDNKILKIKGHDQYKINFVLEGYLVNEFFNKQANNEILLSATIGECEMFKYSIGAQLLDKQETNYIFSRIPSTFNFEHSPIYIIPNFKMNYTSKDKNIPYVADLVNKICSYHKNEKGIIHSGTYSFSNEIKNRADENLIPRLLCYDNAKNKQVYLDDYLYSQNKILCGPTLIEGINLPDDDCRFMIIIKVPYGNISDKLINAKKDMIKNWYLSDATNKIIQGLGRGIRSKNDWCVTYIIDGCFCSLYYQFKNNLNPELINRFKFVDC